MKYTLVITCSPLSNSAQNALAFAEALLKAGHDVRRVFFYGDGVTHANAAAIAPQDYLDLPAAWQNFIRKHGIDSVVCIAAALKHGILNATESKRHEKPMSTMIEGHDLSGLGQLVEATQTSDRVVTFH